MGSLQRKINREHMKAKYREFSAEWRKEKERQLREDGETVLRRRPTFSQWAVLYERRAAEIAAAKAEDAAVGKALDLEWKEEDQEK